MENVVVLKVIACVIWFIVIPVGFYMMFRLLRARYSQYKLGKIKSPTGRSGAKFARKVGPFEVRLFLFLFGAGILLMPVVIYMVVTNPSK